MSDQKITEISLPTINGGKNLITLAKDWLAYIQHRQTIATCRSYKSAILLFLDFLPPAITPTEITPQHIENFLSDIVENHKISTANNYLMVLRSFYRWAEKFSNLQNPAAPVTELKKPPTCRRILSELEYRTILDLSKGHARNAIQFLANTGLRRNEFRFLTWQNFSDDFVCITGKGGKIRYVPLNQTCKQILNSDQSGISPPFIIKFRPKKSLYKLCSQLSQKANIKYFTPHSFRHFFATRLIRKGVPIMVVSKILGHSSIQTTEQIYVHLEPNDLRVTGCLDY